MHRPVVGFPPRFVISLSALIQYTQGIIVRIASELHGARRYVLIGYYFELSQGRISRFCGLTVRHCFNDRRRISTRYLPRRSPRI